MWVTCNSIIVLVIIGKVFIECRFAGSTDVVSAFWKFTVQEGRGEAMEQTWRWNAR